MVRDDESRETHDAADRAGQAARVDFFQDEAEADRAPGDEEGGGVEVGDGRAALQPHARDEAGAHEHEGEGHEIKGGATEHLGPLQPGENREQERGDEEHHAGVEGRGGLEARLGADLGHARSEALVDLLLEQPGDGVELLRLLAAPGEGEAGVAESVGLDGAGLEGVEQHVAGAAPGGVVGLGLGRRHGHEVGVLRHEIEARGEVHQAGGGLLVVRLALLAQADGGDAGGEVFLKGLELAQRVLELGRHEGGLEAHVEAEIVAQGDDGALERGALLGLDRHGQLGLALELGEPRGELGVGETFFARAVGLGYLHQGEQVGVDDLEDLVGVGLLRIEQHVGDPLRRGELFAPGGAHGLAALELEEGGAGDGIQRLDTAADQHGQFAEGDVVGRAVRRARRHEGVADVDQAEGEDEERDNAAEGHRAEIFLTQRTQRARRRRRDQARSAPGRIRRSMPPSFRRGVLKLKMSPIGALSRRM